MIKRTKKHQTQGYWFGIFECSLCGKQFETSINHVSTGKVHTCGCHRDLSGRKYGMLTVIEKSGEFASDGRPLWRCICDCGNYKLVGSNSLSKGLTSSCGCMKSKGETKIAKILQENNVKFYREYCFDDGRYSDSNIKMRYDFYLPDYNCCIEYDGEQHFRSVNFFGGEKSFKKRQFKDLEKELYCKEKNIKIIRIKYNDFDNIDFNYIKEKVYGKSI